MVDEEVNWTGASGDWGFRRMVLHYAHLCVAAGGVDAFLIGGQLPGLTTVRSSAGSYPAVDALVDLVGDVRAILGNGSNISYAADWTEYSDHHPDDSPGDVSFHLDPLWSNAAVDFVSIDNFMLVSDWRGGADHLDAVAGWESIYDRAYPKANMAAGEDFDWGRRFWARGYFSTTSGNVTDDIIMQYLELHSAK